MKILNKKEITEDLEHLTNCLMELHPNPFKFLTKGEFKKEIDSIKNHGDQLSIREFGFLIMKLLARLNDGHTDLGLSDEVLGTDSFPFAFKYVTDGFYVIRTTNSLEKYLGWKLVAVNGVAINDISQRLKVIIPIENKASLNYYLSSKLVEPNILKYFEISDSDSAEFTFERNGDLEKVVIKTVNYNTELINLWDRLLKVDDTLIKKGLYSLKNYRDRSVLYLQYNECEEDEDYPMAQVVKDIKKANRKKLIIDLRNNKGGDSDVLLPLLRYIRKTMGLSVVVLCGVDTYSSGIYNLVQLSQLKNVTTIGEIPHGNPTHYGEVESFTLPNSKLDIYCSTKIFRFKGYSLGESFIPRKEVKTSSKDYVQGIDTLMRNL